MTENQASPLALADWQRLQAGVRPGAVVAVENGDGPFGQLLLDGRHVYQADEPADVGGRDVGPGPYELLLMALGSCTAMTLRMYARQKGWPLDRVTVRLRHAKIHAQDCAECETKVGMIDRIERVVEIAGELSAEQRTRLLEIAEKCPVHRTLTGEIRIDTRAA